MKGVQGGKRDFYGKQNFHTSQGGGNVLEEGCNQNVKREGMGTREGGLGGRGGKGSPLLQD